MVHVGGKVFFIFFFNHFTAEAQRRGELHCNRENCNRENRELLFFSFFLLKVVCGSFGGGVVLCASVSLWRVVIFKYLTAMPSENLQEEGEAEFAVFVRGFHTAVVLFADVADAGEADAAAFGVGARGVVVRELEDNIPCRRICTSPQAAPPPGGAGPARASPGS